MATAPVRTSGPAKAVGVGPGEAVGVGVGDGVGVGVGGWITRSVAAVTYRR